MGIKESLAHDRVSDLALRQPVCSQPGERIRPAIRRMRKAGLGCLIIVNDDHKPLGMITESMITQLIAKNPSALDGTAGQLMSEICPWVRMTDSVALVLEAMESQNTRFLCVVDDSGRVAGLTGQKGLMEYIADHFPQQVMVLRTGSLPPLDREGA